MSSGFSMDANFEGALLSYIWKISAFLAIASIALLGILVVRRAIFARQDSDRTKRKDELRQYIYIALDSPISLDEVILPRLVREDAVVLIEIALNMVRSLQQDEAKKIIGFVKNWTNIDQLKEILAQGRRGARIQVLTFLAHYEDSASLDLIKTHAKTADPYVKLAALRGLAMRDTSSLTKEMISDLQASRDINSAMLADVLRHFGVEGLPALHDLVHGETNPRVLHAAIVAVGNIRSPASVPILLSLLKNPSAQLRRLATASLGEIGDEAAAAQVAHMLDDEDTQVRINAAMALGLIGAEATLPDLVSAMSDGAWWVRFRAAEALYNAGGMGYALLQATARLEGQAAEIAAQVLAEKAVV